MDTTQTLWDLVGQTVKIFVPAIGITEGVVQTVETGSPIGAAKIFVPGIGVIEGVMGAGGDVWELAGAGVQGEVTNALGNIGLSFGTLAIGVGAVLLLIVLLKK